VGETSWPATTHNARAVTDAELEQYAIAYSQSGLYGSPADAALVFGDSSGRQVKLRASRSALVRGQLWQSDGSGVTKTIAANSSGSTRYDLIVLRFSRTTWDVRSAVVQGIPGAGVPAVTQNAPSSGVWELPLASVKVINGASTIAAADVTPVAWYIGPPSVVCTSDTRPPPTAGVRIFETDTSREYVGNGSAFVTSIDDSGWVSLSAASGWNLSGNGKVRKRTGSVWLQLRGTRTGSQIAVAGISTIATIPAAYRPDQQAELVFYMRSGNLGHGYARPDGSIVIDDFWITINTGDSVIAAIASWPTS
jgi:hypothetical protein